jgi:hypothetical protein
VAENTQEDGSVLDHVETVTPELVEAVRKLSQKLREDRVPAAQAVHAILFSTALIAAKDISSWKGQVQFISANDRATLTGIRQALIEAAELVGGAKGA